MPFRQSDWGKRVETVSRSIKTKNFVFLILFVLSVSFLSCPRQAPAAGVYHLVKKQETLFSIARAYNIEVQELARVNGIEDANTLKEGTVLYIPRAAEVIDSVPPIERNATPDKKPSSRKDQSGAVSPSPQRALENGKDLAGESAKTPEKSIRPSGKFSLESYEGKKPEMSKESPAKEPGKEEKDLRPQSSLAAQTTSDQKTFIWPVKGVVATNFGRQPNKTFYNWVKIVLRNKAQVKAAASGRVIFSSYLKNYGETIIIRHKNNYATVYTHLQKRGVAIDQTVKKGEIIAWAGEKDENGDIFINFEIRRKGKAVDPLAYLP
jgi:lipoprotein NlpD